MPAHDLKGDRYLRRRSVAQLGRQHLLGGERVALWVHGHTHDSFDYEVAGTRVLCNPRGYARDGVNENAAFDPALVVSIG